MQPTKNFPPDPKFTQSEGGGNGYWVNACGIDDLNANGAGVTKVSFMVMTDATKILDTTTVRYFYSGKGMSNPMGVTVSKLYDQSSAEAETKGAVISGPHKYDKVADTYYFDFTWDDYNIANSGKKYQFTIGLYYGDTWDPSDDWSYNGLEIFPVDDAFHATGNEVKLSNICVYSGDEFLGGVEPDGSVPETAEPEPDTEPTTKPDPRPEADYGDANCDGSISLSDAVLVMQYLGNPDAYGVGGSDKNAITEQGMINADCYNTGDGVTNNDALSIQKYMLKLISALPEK